MVIGGKQPFGCISSKNSDDSILWASMYLCWTDMVAPHCKLCVCCDVTDGGSATDSLHCTRAGDAMTWIRRRHQSRRTKNSTQLHYLTLTLVVKLDIVMPQPAISTTVHSVTVTAALESMLNCLQVADSMQFVVADVLKCWYGMYSE